MPMRSAAVAGPAPLLFHSLADPARLEIVRLLSDGERRVVDLTRALGLAQSTISGHLARLCASGVVEARPDGRATYYRLARPELGRLLAAADGMLRASGATASLCPEHHRPVRAGER